MIITVIRKPFKGTLIENVRENQCGGISINDTRIAIDPVADKSQLRTLNRSKKEENNGWGMNTLGGDTPQVVDPSGRWPANLLLSHLGGCECVGTTQVRSSISGNKSMTSIGTGKIYRGGKERIKNGFGDEKGLETIESWSCVEGCSVKALDKQSGILKSGAMDSFTKGGSFTTYGKMYPRRVVNPASEGGASRFFKVIK